MQTWSTHMPEITVIAADITKQDTDAIVNSANTSLLKGGGVCGQIHKAAGPELEEECRALGGCATGEAKITRGYNLKSRYVIHACGPRWLGGGRNEAALLASCYQNSLLLADEHGCKSISFPSISTGIYHFPLVQAADIAITTLMEAAKQCKSIEKIVLVCFDKNTALEYQAACARQKERQVIHDHPPSGALDENGIPCYHQTTVCPVRYGYGLEIAVRTGDIHIPAHAHVHNTDLREIGRFLITNNRPSSYQDVITIGKELLPVQVREIISKWANEDNKTFKINNWLRLQYAWDDETGFEENYKEHLSSSYSTRLYKDSAKEGKMWSLYLDDERNPKTTPATGEWVVCRTVADAITEIELRSSFPSYISFDHDLGDNCPTGFDFAKWLVEQELSGTYQFSQNFHFNVHSANPVGKKNIEGYLEGYFKHRQR